MPSFDLTGLNRALTVAGGQAAAVRAEERKRLLAIMRQRAGLEAKEATYQRRLADRGAVKAEEREYKEGLAAKKSSAAEEKSLLKLLLPMIRTAGGDPGVVAGAKGLTVDAGDSVLDIAAAAAALKKQADSDKEAAKKAAKQQAKDIARQNSINTKRRKIDTRNKWLAAYGDKLDSEEVADGLVVIPSSEHAEARKWMREIEELEGELEAMGETKQMKRKKTIPGF